MEQLESRVLLSADGLPAATFLAGTVHHPHGHQEFVAAHQTPAPGAHSNAAAIGYDPADKVSDIFQGVTGEALHSEVAAPKAESISNESRQDAAAVAPLSDTRTVESGAVTQNSPSAVVSQTRTIINAVATRATITTTGSATTQLPVSATGTSGGANTRQMTDTLTIANAPPVPNTLTPGPAPTDLETFILSTLSGQSGSYTATVTPGVTMSVGGSLLQLNGVALTFQATENNGVWSGSVSITATSGVIYSGQNFSATIGPVINTQTNPSTYIIGNVPSGSHRFSLSISSLNLQIGQALVINTSQLTFTYDSGVSSAQTIATIAGATVSSPLFPGLGTATLSGLTLRTDGFSFNSFTLSTSSLSLGNYFSATTANVTTVTNTPIPDASGNPPTILSNGVYITNPAWTPTYQQVSTTAQVPVSLVVTGGLDSNNNPLPFNLSFANPGSSTASVELTAGQIQLFPGAGFLNLSFTNVTGTFDLIHTTGSGSTSTSTIGSATLSIALGSVNFSVGDAFTIQMGNVTLQPGEQDIASVTGATITTSLIGGFQTYSLGSFQLTQQGFSLSNVVFTPLSGTYTLGGFLGFTPGSFTISSFSLNVDTNTLTSSITASVNSLTLFPNSSLVTSTFTNVGVHFDFTSVGSTGSLTFTADSVSLTVANEVTLTAGGITLTPDQSTILSINTATITLPQLNNLTGQINSGGIPNGGLTVLNNGFTIGNGSFTASNTSFSLGGLLSFSSAPTVTLTNLSYTAGGSLGGVIALSPVTVDFNLGSAAASGAFSGNYNLKTGVLEAELDSFAVSFPNFVSINGSGLLVTYEPANNNNGQSTFLIGGTGINLTLGSASGGVQVGGATFALEILENSGTSTFAFDANGSLSLVGIPTSTLNFSASNIEVRDNTIGGSVDQYVNVDSNPADAVHLVFTGNEQSMVASNLSLNVANVVALTGDFGFQAFQDPHDSSQTDVVIGAQNVTAVLGTPTTAANPNATNLTITGASLSLLIQPQSGSNAAYELVANGGTDSLNGVPGLSVSASGLSVKVNTTSLTSSDIAGLPQQLTTPDGTLTLDYSGLSSGSSVAVEGSISLNIAGFVSLSGDFGFQTFTDTNGSQDILIGAQKVNATLGTPTTINTPYALNLTISGASLYAIVIPGTGGSSTTYALVANGGTDSLNGVTGLSLSTSNLSVKINTTGVDPTTLGAPASVPTPDGPVSASFTGLGAANLTDIEGSLSLDVANFISLQGSFGFQSFKDSTTGLTDLAIGATGINATLGTANANLQISGASLGVLIVAGSSGTSSTYALVANGGTDTLNGLPEISGLPVLSITASGLSVKINELGADPSALPGIPTAIHTPGGDVTLNFSGLGSGTLQDVEGSLTLSVLNFVTLQGSFAFQTFTDLVSGQTDLAFAATGVNAALTVGSVSLTITGASLGLLVLPGATADSSTYALIANGGSDKLAGITGLNLSATGLSVRINNTGVDPTTRTGTASLATSTGSVPLNFTGLGSGNFEDIEGNITLTIAGFVTLSGSFGFQEYNDTANAATEILVGATGVNAVLGTSTTNLSISNASLGIIIVPGSGYALVSNSGTDALNGVPGLSLSTNGLTVMYDNGVSSALLSGASAQSVHTSNGNVTLDFSSLNGSNVTEVAGGITLNVSGFVSLSGNFEFTEQTSPTNSNVTEILAGASGVNAFLGTSDQKVGVQIINAELGLVVYRDNVALTTTYALYASAPIQLVGLPSDINFGGTLGVAINTTGAAVTQTINTPDSSVSIQFTDGTGGTPDQRNIETFSGNLTLSIGPSTNPLFSLTGSFAFTKAVVSGQTELLIGATGVSSSNIIPDNNAGATVTIANGSLGLIIFTQSSGGTSSNSGYALTASATVTAGVSGATGSLTLTIRRNTTTGAVSQTVTAGSGSVQVNFAGTEVATASGPFQTIAVSNASLSIDNTLIITAGSGGSTTSGGVTTQTLTGVTLTLQDPNSGTVYFSITATSASYSTITAGTTYDGLKWVNGGRDIVLNNLSFSIGGYVVFTGTVDIQHYTNSSNAVITAFNFTNSTISIYVNSQPMVSLSGSFAFSYSTAGGFALTGSPTISNFAFLGQSLGGSPAGTLALSGAQTLGSSGSHTLGPITFGTPSIGLSNFSLQLDGTLSVTVTISDPQASISGSVVSATLTNLSGSFNLGLKLNLASPLSPPTNITASGFNLSVGTLAITVSVSSNVSLVLSASGVAIDPTAGPTSPVVSFGGTADNPGLSATLNVGSLSFTGGASNFSITGNGSFVAGNNFSVTLGLGANTTSSSLSWPSWLPIQNVSITLVWNNNNFNADPTNFLMDISADINLSSLNGIPLTINGSVKNLIINVGALAAGQFPIVSLDAAGVTVTGNLFGGTVSGTLIAGVVRFDSNGNVVDSNGNLVSTGAAGVGPFHSVFYGGINASFNVGGISGFQIMIGLTQYGPISAYVSASIPIVLDPESGLTITNLRGGIYFGEGLPVITVSNPIQASDALQLRQPGFTPPSQLTLDQWQAQLAAAVAQLYSGSTPSSSWSNLGAATITFQLGATLYDEYASQDAIKIDADILFDTTGKFLVVGTATFGDSLTLGVKIYADLSPVISGTEASSSAPGQTSLNILFLIDFPTQSSTTLVSTPILSIYGVLQFTFGRLDGTTVTQNNPADFFQINIAGEADLNVMGGFQASLKGNLSLTFTATYFNLTISNVALSVSYLGTIGTAAGSLTIQKDGSGLDIWGAFLLTFNLQQLENVGINVGGTVYFELNTTSQIQPVTLHLIDNNNQPYTVPLSLQPTSFSLFVQGDASFELGGQQVFDLSGTLAIDLNINTTTSTPTFTLTIFVEATLNLGPSGNTLFSFQANGLIYVDNYGFAAKMTLTAGASPLNGITIGENWLLVMNTTGETITYTIPTPPTTSPPTAPVPVVMGPDFSSSNVLATISYETPGPNGSRTLVIPNGAPPTGTTNFAAWTPTGPSDYVILLGRGLLTISASGTSFTLSGTMNLLASYNPNTSQVNFSFEVNANLTLAVSNHNVFSFSALGFIQISDAGLVAAVQLSFANGTGVPSALGFSFSGSLTITLEINTTSGSVTVPGTNLTLLPNTLEVAINGSMSISGFSISGEFDLKISSTSITVTVNATISLLSLTFSVDGFAGIYYDNDPGFVLNITLKLGSSTNCTLYPVSSLGNLFVVQGSLILEINTCSQSRNGVNPGFVISIPSVQVYLFGLNLTGSAYFSITSGNLTLSLNLSLDFFGFFNLSFSGYVNTGTGDFSITASANFEYDWSIGIFSGEIYAYATVTISNSGFYASVGLGIHVDGIGSLGASADIYISDNEFKMDVSIDIGICDVGFTIDFGSEASPPAPPPSPTLANEDANGVLYLNFGQDVANRDENNSGTYFGAQSSENYVLTDPSQSDGTVVISALGYTQTFTGVTKIVVNNTADSGGVTTSDTVNISNEVSEPVVITLGNNNSNITTGGGYATIYDTGNGSNTVTAGSGGGVYYGGLNGSSNPYSSKGTTTVNGMRVVESGYANYSLTNSQLQYGSYLLDLSNVTAVTLNASSTTANTFALLSWTGDATLNGFGSNNTLTFNPLGGLQTATFVLTNSSLTVTVGTSASTNTLSDIQTANLTGDAKGINTYNVSGWSGGGSLTGPSGSTNTVIATNDLSFTLTNNVLSRSGRPDLQLQNIQNAQLTGGASPNIFTVQNWNGNATLTGVGGNDTYNLTLTGVGAGTISVTDSTPNSNDMLNLFAGASTAVTSAQLQVAAQVVNYAAVKTLNVNGTAAGLTYNIQSTNRTTTTTITATGSGNTFKLGSTAGIAPAQPGQLGGILGNLVLSGGGQDGLNLDDSGNLLASTGVMTPTTIDFAGLGTIAYSGMAILNVALGSGADSFTIVDTIASASANPVIVVSGNGGNDTFNILQTHAVTTINGGNGNDTFWVFGNSQALNLNGDGGSDVFNVFASVAAGQQTYNVNALLNISGGTAASEELNLYGTVLNDVILVNGSTFTSLGLNAAFTNITGLQIYGLGGNDTFNVQSVVVRTTLIGDGSLPAFALPAGVNAPDLTAGAVADSYDDTFNIGWQGASVPGSLAGINAPLTIQGGPGNDTAIVDDSADTANRNLTLTPTTLVSNAMGARGLVIYDATLDNLNVRFGSGNDTLTVNNMSYPTVTTVDGGPGNNSATLNFSGDFAAKNLTLLNFQTATLSVSGNFTGLLNDAGAFTTVTINGSMTATGIFNAGSINTMTVGGDLAGLLNVNGLLNTLAINGGSPGEIIAGAINYITVQSGFGDKVLQVIEGGIERQIQAAPVAGGTLSAQIRFAFMYDSSAPGDPQIAIQVANSGAVAARSFNLSLVAINSDAQFNLALIYATAATGIGNITVSGNILFNATSAELNFLHLAATARTGVVLPFDKITGVEVSGILPIGFVDVAGIEGVAFGLLETVLGQVVNILGDLGSVGQPQVLWNLLGSHAALLAATDALTVSFNENRSVQVFAQCNSNPTLEYVMTLTDQLNDGLPVWATVKIQPGNTPLIQSISFRGDGAAVNSRYSVASITSTGSLGDIIVGGSAGLGSVTASGIFGNINVTSGAITGIIQTTGIRTDPVTGAQTSVSADIGQFTYNARGAVSGVTTIYAARGITSTGQILSRGNLVSTVRSGGAFNGVIAAQGNIGAILTNADGTASVSATGQLTRFGGISITGNATGQIISLGNVLGDITVTGSLSGRIAAQGQAVSGLAALRIGILGNVRLGSGFTSSAAVVSGGLIGDPVDGTAFSAAGAKGLLAADGAISLGTGTRVTVANLFANSQTNSNAAVINAIFTINLQPLQFDTGGTLQGLALLRTDLKNIHVANGKLAGTIP